MREDIDIKAAHAYAQIGHKGADTPHEQTQLVRAENLVIQLRNRELEDCVSSFEPAPTDDDALAVQDVMRRLLAHPLFKGKTCEWPFKVFAAFAIAYWTDLNQLRESDFALDRRGTELLQECEELMADAPERKKPVLESVDVCPYCNVAILPKRKVAKGNRKMQEVPDLDHAFNKDLFPYLALSLFNLVPACSDCNRRIKERRTLNYRQHAHPYADDVHAHVRFQLPEDYIQDAAGRLFAPMPKTIEVGLRTPKSDSRALGVMTFFDVQGQCQQDAQRLKAAQVLQHVMQGQEFEEFQRKSLGKDLPSRAEFERLVYGCELRPDAINKYENGKLILDAYEQCVKVRQQGKRNPLDPVWSLRDTPGIVTSAAAGKVDGDI